MLRAGFAIGRSWLMAAVLALLTIACVGLVAHANRMLYGPPAPDISSRERGAWRLAPLALCLGALLVLGLFVPAPITSLLRQIAEIAGP